MTRKDFELIADAIATAYAFEPQTPRATQALIIDALSDALARTNPNFDRLKFSKACEGVN